MFFQVRVLQCDQPFLRFLWLEDPTSTVVVHQYKGNISGLNTQPTALTMNCSARHVIMLNSIQRPQKPSLRISTWTITYILFRLTLESPERALIRSRKLVHLLQTGWFKITKFAINVPDLTDRIDESPQSTDPNVIVLSKEESMHVFGLSWHHNNDTLVVSKGTNSTITKSLTQRFVLSLVSKVYDTIGLFAPFFLGARLILNHI